MRQSRSKKMEFYDRPYECTLRRRPRRVWESVLYLVSLDWNWLGRSSFQATRVTPPAREPRLNHPRVSHRDITESRVLAFAPGSIILLLCLSGHSHIAQM